MQSESSMAAHRFWNIIDGQVEGGFGRWITTEANTAKPQKKIS